MNTAEQMTMIRKMRDPYLDTYLVTYAPNERNGNRMALIRDIWLSGATRNI
jgi:hypothetical protein